MTGENLEQFVSSEGEEVVDMCEALEAMRRENFMLGKVEGRLESCQGIARELIRRNQPLDFVAQVTGLSAQEVQVIQQNMQ